MHCVYICVSLERVYSRCSEGGESLALDLWRPTLTHLQTHNKPPGTGGTQIDELVADVVGLLRVELGGHQYVGVVFPVHISI